jgi:hypothetical protein
MYSPFRAGFALHFSTFTPLCSFKCGLIKCSSVNADETGRNAYHTLGETLNSRVGVLSYQQQGARGWQEVDKESRAGGTVVCRIGGIDSLGR